MEKIKAWLRNFMYGRNGIDDCGKVTIWTSLIVYIIAIISKKSILCMVSLILMYYALFRILSRNRDKRVLENQKFINYFQVIKLNYEQRKTHRIFVCKRCGKKIRVPKGKGKIEITCPQCGNRMIHRA